MTIIWHDPRDPASQAALEMLTAAGHVPTIRYLDRAAPSAEEIVRVRNALGLHTIELVRVDEPVFSDLDLADSDDEALVAAMARHPALIRRPVVFADGKVAMEPDAIRAIL